MTNINCNHCGQSSFVPGRCACRKIFYRVEDHHETNEWIEHKSIFSDLLEDDFTPVAELAAREAHRGMDYEEAEYTVFVKRRDGKPKKYKVEATVPPVEVEFEAMEAIDG